ncbi:hypothetical protein ACFU98_29560 [Streptomyces sp. NPDC057575]|uniref:hypothetical protein n=1 Tax=unclassified Streptomyces TaxID=2593676 RepID=UPI0036A5516E
MFGKPGSATAETKATRKSRVRINGRDTTTEPPQTNPGTEATTTEEPAKKSRVRFNSRSK